MEGKEQGRALDSIPFDVVVCDEQFDVVCLFVFYLMDHLMN